MSIELRILGGARTGYSETFDKSVIAVGRHPTSDLKFDPRQDLDVSTRHGEIRLLDGRYTIYDAQSTNGTFVNGQRVAPGGMCDLHDNDVITFGAQGPMVSVRIANPQPWSVPRSATEPRRVSFPNAPGPAPAPEPPRAQRSAQPRPQYSGQPHPQGAAEPLPRILLPKRSTAERIALAVRGQTRILRVIFGILVIAVAGFAIAVYWKSLRDKAFSRAQIDELVAANARLQTEIEGKMQGDTALTSSLRRRADSLARIALAARGPQQAVATEQLRQNHELQRKLNELNPASIVAANKGAMALITAQTGATPREASGFVVDQSGLLVTNRHVVVDSAGNKTTRIFVRLAGTSGTHRAHVVRVAPDSADLALIQIEGKGPFPAVRGIAATVDAAPGEAVVTLGFPLGTDLPMEGAVVDPSLTMGAVSRSLKDLLQIDSWAAFGASGSAVFDTHGHVIGVVWGGQRGAGGRIVYAVPADRITEMLNGR
ncbi:MAG TPA: trypsin-like peptidase domain-containing protein [Gemmatimonadaceae bacterium]